MEMTFTKHKSIFEKINLRLIDIMKDLPTIGSHLSALVAAQKLKELNRGVLGAIQEGKLVGIVTDSDFTRKVAAAELPNTEILVADIMSYPVKMVPASTSIPEAALMMSLQKIRHLVVDQKDSKWKVISARQIAESMQLVLSRAMSLKEQELSKKKKRY